MNNLNLIPVIHSSKIWKESSYLYKGFSFPLYSGYHFHSILDHGVRVIEDLYLRREATWYGMFTIRFPNYFSERGYLLDNNCCMCSCMEMFLRDIRGYRPVYVWVRERNLSELQHYHVGIWVDENVCKSLVNIGAGLQYRWSCSLDDMAYGCVEYMSAEKSKILLKRGDVGSMRDCVYAYSYLSKTYSKESELGRTRRWEHSR